jgi:hypothetical protein
MFVSCVKTNTKQVLDVNDCELVVTTKRNYNYKVFEWEYNNHTYIIIEKLNGSGITHAGHCKCQNRE